MKKYAKIINEYMLCEVGVGTNTEFYKSIGMEEMEVEQAYNGEWYIKGYAPQKPAPTEDEIQQYFEDSIESYMTTVVQTRNYKDIHTAASYCNSTNEKFRREGIACNKWRDDVWDKCYAILAEVKAGNRPIPTLEEVIAELPKLDWGDTE